MIRECECSFEQTFIRVSHERARKGGVLKGARVDVKRRRLEILNTARRDGRVAVETLAASLGVSPHTIRRDINLLCDEAKLRRQHGGAVYVDPPANLPYGTRATLNIEAKTAIARRIADIVPDGATLFFSIGTTPALVAAALADKDRLTVITNNLNAANALAQNASNRIILPGGELRLPDRDILGPEAARIFKTYRADFGIYGVGGIGQDGALLDFHASEVRVREQIRLNSLRSLLVVDATKFGRHAAAVGGRLEDVDCLVIDRMPPAPFDDLVRNYPGSLVVATEAGYAAEGEARHG